MADGYAATGQQDGSCASAVLISGDGRAEILNCGDCRTLLCATEEEETGSGASGGQGGGGGEEGGERRGGGLSPYVAFATRDHAASDDLEIKRIESVGGETRCGPGGDMRVAVDSPSGLWQVAVARALGGSEWRGGGITNVAETSILRLDRSHRFLVLASDGVWGVLDEESAEGAAARSEGVAWRVAAARAEGTCAGAIAEGIIRLCEREGGTDNASCVVLLLE